MSLSAGVRLGAYEIVSLLGVGGMGEVYRARDIRLNRDVAIKVIPELFAADAERLARFSREAQVLAALNHPGIAQIHDLTSGVFAGSAPAAGTAGTTSHALVMELVEGEDLSAHIARGPIALPEAMSIARQIADALEVAHDQGVIHRDLKPANIKVRADGTVKILDFGLAKMWSPDTGPGALGVDPSNSPTLTGRATEMGMILGTAAYMAPEQARGRAVDRRADIWAFGVVLYEMLAGRRAFEGDDVSITLANVLKEDVAWAALPAELPPSVRRLLRRCLEKDPKRRLSAIGDARLELDDAARGADEAAARPSTSVTPGWQRAAPWVVAGAAALAAVVVGLNSLGSAAATAAPTWTSIAAPVSRFSRALGPALSPDGQRVAFVAADESGSERLWIRALDAQSARIIAGTEGATLPFWSPDSRSIGFFKDQKLQTVSADGGSHQILADAYNPRGATWGRDGVIVFSPSSGLGLHRVPASGGGAAVRLDVDRSATWSGLPSFLPDGQHFLYTSVHDNETWINVGSLAGATNTPLLKAFSRAEYANGYLLFGSKGSLYAQAFDPATLTLSGDRLLLIDSLGYGAGNTLNYSFSAADDVIAAGNAPFIGLSQLWWFDATGARIAALGEPGHIFGFAVAPDSTRIVVERLDTRTNSVDPWILELGSGFTTPQRAASEGALASSPVWSHDGERLYFSNGYGALQTAARSGGPEDTRPVGTNWPMSSSPDGRFLLLARPGATGTDLMVVTLSGKTTVESYLSTSFNEGLGRFSPDGTSVAYVSDESSRNEVYIQAFPRTSTKVRVSASGGTDPQWSRDGSQLYFLEREPDGTASMMVVGVHPGGATAPRRLFAVPPGHGDSAVRSQFAVFDNGRRFLVNVLAPVSAPQVITVGQHWAAGLQKRR